MLSDPQPDRLLAVIKPQAGPKGGRTHIMRDPEVVIELFRRGYPLEASQLAVLLGCRIGLVRRTESRALGKIAAHILTRRAESIHDFDPLEDEFYVPPQLYWCASHDGACSAWPKIPEWIRQEHEAFKAGAWACICGEPAWRYLDFSPAFLRPHWLRGFAHLHHDRDLLRLGQRDLQRTIARERVDPLINTRARRGRGATTSAA